MKYIRTKDSIYVYDKAIQNIKSYWKTTFLSKYKINKYIKKDIEKVNKNIIKQADTIEELCDELLFVGQDNVPIILDVELKHAKDRADDLELTEWAVYGAIWTDKGLIYVAKMNDKGELELL